MPTHEHTINDAVAALLRKTRRAWRHRSVVTSENTGVLGDTARRPDILVVEPDVSPVTIEAEILPASSVEEDVVSRLGAQLSRTGRTILSSIALRYPGRFAQLQGLGLAEELQRASDFEMALYTGTASDRWTRWPATGWIKGTIADLSLLTQSASVPPEVIESAANELVAGVSEAAGLMEDMSLANAGAVQRVAEQLCQEDSEQTRRMATTILANALVFQESLAGGAGRLAEVKSLEELRGSESGLTKATVLAEWRKILKVNYWPIFDIARRILEVLPAAKCKPLLNRLAQTADRLLENRLMHSHDLTGAVFQKLIADRKFLAAFYTTPASAALLLGLVITPDRTPNGGSWASADDVKALRIADFACGTGTLLSTAYQRVGQLHELCGGDSEAIHPDMMAHSIIGCDVLPAAAHLTASMISGAHPTVEYSQSSILTVAYGKQPGGGIALGSLDLLSQQGRFSVLDITAKAASGMGESERVLWETLPHSSFDVVVMNPPFTRSTGHEGAKIGVPMPMFAAFASSAEEQRLMSAATKRLTKDTSAHGNAGEASIFLVLADRKLKEGGGLALVMPLSLMLGESWTESRALLGKSYRNLALISIAGDEDQDLSFSADTGMGECLVVGEKHAGGCERAAFIILNNRPAYPLLGSSIARQITAARGMADLRQLEDGPVGGTSLTFGGEIVGKMIEAPLSHESGWHLARIRDVALAQTAFQLGFRSKVWLPMMSESDAVPIRMRSVGDIASIGPYHMDVSAASSSGGIRGPFQIAAVSANAIPTYPVLWAHDAERERTLSFEADCEGIPLKGRNRAEVEMIAARVTAIARTASYSHFNRDFRFNSQSTSMQLTSRKSIGGRAWLSLSLPSVEEEKAIVLWANTTLGLLMYWWHANKQQSGRGTIGKAALANMPILDVTAFSQQVQSAAVALFDDMCGRPLKPIHEIDDDPVRQELDHRFCCDVLRLPKPFFESGGPFDILRKKLAMEPSIRGGK